MWVEMWNCHCRPLDVNSNIKIAIVDHDMSVEIWSSYSGPVDVCKYVNLPLFTSICQ